MLGWSRKVWILISLSLCTRAEGSEVSKERSISLRAQRKLVFLWLNKQMVTKQDWQLPNVLFLILLWLESDLIWGFPDLRRCLLWWICMITLKLYLLEILFHARVLDSFLFVLTSLDLLQSFEVFTSYLIWKGCKCCKLLFDGSSIFLLMLLILSRFLF